MWYILMLTSNTCILNWCLCVAVFKLSTREYQNLAKTINTTCCNVKVKFTCFEGSNSCIAPKFTCNSDSEYLKLNFLNHSLAVVY